MAGSTEIKTRKFLQVEHYTPPSWALCLPSIPQTRINLALLPSPVHLWSPPGLPDCIELWIKRDDMTGNTLSGNKVRKLEFLLADAIDKKCDSVIAIGAVDSNCCRATAVASRYLQMTSHLIMESTTKAADCDPGLVGNLLVDRLVGSHIYQIPTEEYYEIGETELVNRLERDLREKGMNPYPIPVGGSNELGAWGYLDCINEILSQIHGITDIIVACGSGSTIAGLALGNLLSGAEIRIHAYATYDSPDYFYNYVDGLYKEMGITHLLKGRTVRDLFRSVQATGAGYDLTRPEELQKILEIAKSTGVILDPIYTGKAMYQFSKEVNANPNQWKGRKVLFMHTGGLLGFYHKHKDLQPIVEDLNTSYRFKIE